MDRVCMCWGGPFILSAGLVRLFCLLVHIPPSSFFSLFFILFFYFYIFFYFGLRLVFFAMFWYWSIHEEREDRGNDHQSKTRGGSPCVSYIALSLPSLGVRTYTHPVKSACPLFPYALFTSRVRRCTSFIPMTTIKILEFFDVNQI